MRKRKHSRKHTARRSRISSYQPGKRRKTFVRFAMALVGLMAISLVFQGYNSRATAGQPRSAAHESQSQSKAEQKEGALKLKSIRVVPSQDASKAAEKDKASLVK